MLDAAAGAAAAAYGELARWFLDECAPRAATDDGVGEERYRVWARALLGADLDVAEAYEWGTAELARLEAEKDAECERILPGAGFDAVRDHLDRAPEHGVEGVDAYRSGLQELVDEAIEALAGTEFDVPAGLRTCPVAIPPEGSASAPYYTPPTEDLSQPGQVWFPTMGRQHFTMWNEVTTAYHEAVPGHHLQLGTTRLVPLTRAHKLGFNPAHGEGWALYAERLMDELGWFRTPETRLGFLCVQAMRAARVVIDIGLHTGREVPAGLPGASGPWTYELAVAAIGRAGALPEADARSEILRYLSWPSQATAYKLGERTLAGRARRGDGGGGVVLRPAAVARPRPRPRRPRPRPTRGRARHPGLVRTRSGRRDAAAAVDVEDAVQAAEGDPGADAEAELDELVVAEGGVQPGPQVVVHGAVVEGEPLGELHGEALPLGEPAPGQVPDVGVELLLRRIGLAGPATRRRGRSASRGRARSR